MKDIDPKRTNLKATLMSELENEDVAPGALYPIDAHTIAMACPGCGQVSAMHVGNPKPDRKPSWTLTGNLDRLDTVSLDPSVNCIGCCGWHGWLRNGIYTSC